MSALELSLIASRIVNVAFNLYLIGIGIRALHSPRGSFRRSAGITFVMIGAGLLLTQVDHVALNPTVALLTSTLWLGVTLAIVGCVRLLRLVRTPDRRWEEIREVFR